MMQRYTVFDVTLTMHHTGLTGRQRNRRKVRINTQTHTHTCCCCLSLKWSGSNNPTKVPHHRHHHVHHNHVWMFMSKGLFFLGGKNENVHTFEKWEVSSKTIRWTSVHCGTLLVSFWSRLTCGGYGQTIKVQGVNKVMWLTPCPVPNIKVLILELSPLWESLHCHWNHCTAHREHTVTISSLHKWIEEQSSSISSKAQSQSCRPKSSHLKGKISIYSCVTLLHLRWNWCNNSVVVDIFLFLKVETHPVRIREGAQPAVNSGPQLLRD